MADNPIDGMNQSAEKLQASIQENIKMAERFHQASQRSAGAQREALEGISAIYDKIAKQSQKILNLAKETSAAEKTYNALLREQESLKKKIQTADEKEKANIREKIRNNALLLDKQKEIIKERKQNLREMEREIDATKRHIEGLQKTGGLMSQVFSKMKAGLIASVVSVEALRRALFSVLNVSRDIADISIMSGSYAGMGDKDSMLGNTVMIAKYTLEVGRAQAQLSRFGYTAEEAKAAFKDFAQVTSNTESMNAMTQAAGGLSRILGVDLSETTQFMIDQNLKFNRTALQTAEMLQKIQMQTENLNKGFDRSIIKGRDITKVLFDISRESRALAQDQDAISEILTRNIVKLQGTGATYQEAFESARSFTEMLTTKAPVFLQHFSGREVVKQLTENRDQTLEMLKKTSPEIARRVQEIMDDKDLTKVSREKALNRLTQQTKLGLEASQKAMAETMRVFEKGAVDRITAVMGVDEVVAIQLRDQLKESEGIRQIPEMIRDGMAIDEILAFSKEAFGEALPLEDLKKLQQLNAEDREEELKNILMEKHLQEAKRAENERVAAQHREVAALEEKRQKLAQSGKTLLAEQVQKEIEAKKKLIEEEENKKLKDISDKAANKVQKVDWYTFWDVAIQGLKNPLVQMAAGVSGLVLMGALEYKKYTALREIARNTRMGGFGGGGGRRRSMRGRGRLARMKLGKVVGNVGRLGGVGKSLLRGAGTLARGVGRALPLAGTAISAMDLIQAIRSGKGEDWGGAIGGIVGGLLPGGALMGNLIGTQIGGMFGAPADVASIAKPEESPVAANVPGGQQASQITQQAHLVQGAQGTDVQLITTIPFAQAMRLNLDLMSRMGSKAPA